MLLAVDSSTQWIGLAVYDGSLVLGEVNWRTWNNHTVELAEAVQSLLEHCGLQPSDLKAFGVALGPGSFTSLRIGLAVVKGMALGLGLPVVGVPTLDIIAAAVPPAPVQTPETIPLALVLQAGRGRLALGWYHASEGAWKMQGKMELVNREQLVGKLTMPVLVGGELNAADRQALQQNCPDALLLSPAQSARRPSYLAELAWKRWKAGQVDDVVTLSPIYIHLDENLGF